MPGEQIGLFHPHKSIKGIEGEGRRSQELREKEGKVRDSKMI